MVSQIHEELCIDPASWPNMWHGRYEMPVSWTLNVASDYPFGKRHMVHFPTTVSQFSPVQSSSFQPHGLQHARPPCSSPSPEACSNSCPSSWWCHPTISSSVVPFSSSLLSFPVAGCFPMSRFFASAGQSTGVSVSASVLPMNTQDWFPLGWTSRISLQSKGP